MSVFFAYPSSLLGFGFGYQEVLIVAVVFLVLFGGARLPSLMRNMGRSINEFKAGMKDTPEGTQKKSEHLEDKVEDTVEEIEEKSKIN